MDQQTSQCLRLLGPATVDRYPRSQKTLETGEDDGCAGKIPRFRSWRTVALLGYLAVEQRPVSRQNLAALFWPDETLTKGRANLRREIHNLTQILPGCWESDRYAVTFFPSIGTSVDIYRLLELEEQERWGEAAELIRGDFLEGMIIDGNHDLDLWLWAERERWHRHVDGILRRVIKARMMRGRYTEALAFAFRLLQVAPWEEEIHRQAMRLLAWTGQRGAALRQYEQCRLALSEELDVEPNQETIALYHQIRHGTLTIPAQIPAFLSDEKARHPYRQPLFVGREKELAWLEGYLESAISGNGRVIFISGGPGRGKTAILNVFAQQSMEKQRDLLVAYGKCNAYSGIGDPYLPFRDVMAMLTGDLEGRWDAGAISRGQALRLWDASAEVIQELLASGRHLLDVVVSSDELLSRAVVSGEGYATTLSRLRDLVNQRRDRRDIEQGQLFEQFTRVLTVVAQKNPLLIILDDIQWADDSSLNLLFHLGRRLTAAHSRILVACAYRPEEVALGREGGRHPLAKVLGELKAAYGDGWVDLNRSDQITDREFVNSLLDAEPNRLGDEFRMSLFERTGGHPLFTVELLRTMKDQGILTLDDHGFWTAGSNLEWQVLPVRVEAVIQERVGRLDPALREILNVACVEGEIFTAQVVAEVQHLPDLTTLNWLSAELGQRHRLVREEKEVVSGRRWLSQYQFGHILFQDYLYGQLGSGERRLLHKEVATTLERLYDGQLEKIDIKLAHHFRQAGDYENAFRYFSMAGDRAARTFENLEVDTHYTQAIELAAHCTPAPDLLANLYTGRGRAREKLGKFDEARNDHEVALKISRDADVKKSEWRACIELGRLWTSRDYRLARQYFESALALARSMSDPKLLAESLNWMGNWYSNNGEYNQAVKRHQDALIILEELGNRRDLANNLDMLGIATLLGGDPALSIQYYDRAIDLYQDLDDRQMLVSSLIGRATTVAVGVFLASIPVQAPVSAGSDYARATRIAEEIGSNSDLAWLDWSLGLFNIVTGQFGRALQAIQRGLNIANALGHREYMVGNLFALGTWYAEMLAHEQALEHLAKALTMAQELNSPTWILLVVGTLAGVCEKMGDLESTQLYLEKEISPETPMDTLGKRYCWVRLAELALKQGDPALGFSITDKLIATAPGMKSGCVITYLWKLKAEALMDMQHTGDPTGSYPLEDSAISLLKTAIENAKANEERFLLWRLHPILGRLYSNTGNSEMAEREFSAARARITELANTVSDESLKREFLVRASSTYKC